MKFRLVSVAACLLVFAGAAFSQITVAGAANVQFALDEMRAQFTKKTGVQTKAVYGASGALTAQIRNGAPFDVFVSADMGFPDSLSAWGAAAGRAHPYAYGKLVLWSTTGASLDPSLASLKQASVAKIAVADPRKAPYGREAIKALKKTGVYDAVQTRLVFGESITQVSQFVATGNVDVGFDAKSIVVSREMQGKGKWVEVDSTLYDKIAQGAVMTRWGYDHNPNPSAQFLEFLYSAAGRKILADYGYALP